MATLPCCPDRAIARICCLDKIGQKQFVGIGKTGFLSTDGANARTLFDVVGALLDDTVLERPGLQATRLEIDIREVDLVRQQVVQHLVEVMLLQPCRGQQLFSGDLKHGG
jgi:hypothetical protein